MQHDTIIIKKSIHQNKMTVTQSINQFRCTVLYFTEGELTDQVTIPVQKKNVKTMHLTTITKRR